STPDSPKAIELVNRFWQLMQTNEFHCVGTVLSDDFVLEWPQSNERLRGRNNYARMNQEYPAHGAWRFKVNRIVANDSEAVSDVSLTDGVQKARAISFFTVANEKIVRMVEFWPEEFAAEDNRKYLVERFDSNFP